MNRFGKIDEALSGIHLISSPAFSEDVTISAGGRRDLDLLLRSPSCESDCGAEFGWKALVWASLLPTDIRGAMLQRSPINSNF